MGTDERTWAPAGLLHLYVGALACLSLASPASPSDVGAALTSAGALVDDGVGVLQQSGGDLSHRHLLAAAGNGEAVQARP